MTWPLLAVAWVVWTHTSEAPCEDGGSHTAWQRLGGARTGQATVDLSADGRLVAFVSLARLDAIDDNVIDDIYVLDRSTGRVSLETAAAGGRASDGSSDHPRLSRDGRYLVFSTVAQNLIGARSEDMASQVLWRDRATGSTVLASHTPTHLPGNGWSTRPDISEDGHYVVFESRATDLAGGDANGEGSDVYLFDASDQSVRRISVTTSGEQPISGESATPAISATGRVVTFASTAPLDAAPLKSPRAVFWRDLSTGETRRLSATRDGRAANGASYQPAISGDGRRVAFVSMASNLAVDRRATRQEHVYLYDGDTSRLRLLSLSATGHAADGASRRPALNGNGRYAVFSSEASNLQCTGECRGSGRADVNLVSDVYRVDTATGVAERVSGGASARDPWWTASYGAAIDATGRVVAYSSRQPLDDTDLDHDDDLFVEVLPDSDGTATEARRAAPCGPADPRAGRRSGR